MQGSDPHMEGSGPEPIPMVLRDQSGCLERLGREFLTQFSTACTAGSPECKCWSPDRTANPTPNTTSVWDCQGWTAFKTAGLGWWCQGGSCWGGSPGSSQTRRVWVRVASGDSLAKHADWRSTGPDECWRNPRDPFSYNLRFGTTGPDWPAPTCLICLGEVSPSSPSEKVLTGIPRGRLKTGQTRWDPEPFVPDQKGIGGEED